MRGVRWHILRECERPATFCGTLGHDGFAEPFIGSMSENVCRRCEASYLKAQAEVMARVG